MEISLTQCPIFGVHLYPHAIVRALGVNSAHKTKDEGYRAQLAAAAGATGNNVHELETALKEGCYGARHDRLDAFLSAWIAATPQDSSKVYGALPDDVI